jgi:hypothetical protein
MANSCSSTTRNGGYSIADGLLNALSIVTIQANIRRDRSAHRTDRSNQRFCSVQRMEPSDSALLLTSTTSSAIVPLDPGGKVPLAFRDRYFRHSSNCHNCGASTRVSSSSFFFLLALSSLSFAPDRFYPRHGTSFSRRLLTITSVWQERRPSMGMQ